MARFMIKTLSLDRRFNLRLGGYIPYGMRFLRKSHLPYGFFKKATRVLEKTSKEELGDAWELLEKASRLLVKLLEYLPASWQFVYY